jgi:hypothetical protein
MEPSEGFWIYDSAQAAAELTSGFLTVTQPREIALYEQSFAELSAMAVYGTGARRLIASAIEALA